MERHSLGFIEKNSDLMDTLRLSFLSLAFRTLWEKYKTANEIQKGKYLARAQTLITMNADLLEKRGIIERETIDEERILEML